MERMHFLPVMVQNKSVIVSSKKYAKQTEIFTSRICGFGKREKADGGRRSERGHKYFICIGKIVYLVQKLLYILLGHCSVKTT